jgi:hypothetical protein
VLLTSWCIVWFAIDLTSGGTAWHFFVKGQYALSHPGHPLWGGLHVYAGLPVLQIGPLALAVAWLFSLSGTAVSQLLGQVFGAAVGVAIVWTIHRFARELRPDLPTGELATRTRWATLFFAPVWLYLAVSSVHLDDVLAMLFGVLAVLAVVRRRPALVGLCAGLAVDSKPWALPFIAVALALPGVRDRVRSVIGFAVTVAAGWLPFFLADPHTINAVHYTIVNTPYSALRVLGVTDPRTPRWDRPLQSVLGLLIGWAAVRRGRWLAVLMLVVATRMALDPGTNHYYPGGLVVGALLWDLAGSGLRWPWWTATAATALFALRYLPLEPALNGWLTLAYFLAGVGFLALRAPQNSKRSSWIDDVGTPADRRALRTASVSRDEPHMKTSRSARPGTSRSSPSADSHPPASPTSR